MVMAPKYYAAPKLLFGITEDKDHNDMNKHILPQGFFCCPILQRLACNLRQSKVTLR